ncbi:hypothetical protein FOZ60_007805, partial [Perkinsus olseni]
MSNKQFIVGVSIIAIALISSNLPTGDAIGAVASHDGYPPLSGHSYVLPDMSSRTAVCTFGNTTLKGREVSALEINLEENLISTGKADKITRQMCADGLATLRKIFPTYHDLCTKYYNIAEEAKRAGGKGVKTSL